MLLAGDAGIGKTALWSVEQSGPAREHGLRVLTSRSAHSETQIAFATVGDLFAPVVEQTLPQVDTGSTPSALETALLMREPDGPPPEVRLLGLALLSVVRAVTRTARCFSASTTCNGSTRARPSSRFMLRRLEGGPVGVLATVRGRPVGVPLELDKAFAAFRWVEVEALPAEAIHRLLWGRFGST